MKSRSLARELALLVLGQIPEDQTQDVDSFTIETLQEKALDTLMEHWREGLDSCANQIQSVQQNLLDIEEEQTLKDASAVGVRESLNDCLLRAEQLLNSLSSSLEMPRLLALGNQQEIRQNALNRVILVVQTIDNIDLHVDEVMEGWRLKRLPRIDRDILRLAFIDIHNLETPIAVACNEAVELANRYSDEQGRRMINGVLRRLQSSYSLGVS